MARGSDGGPGSGSGGSRIGVEQVAAALLALLALVFVLENTRKIKIRFIFPQVTSPLWVALLLTLVVGVAAGFLLGRRGR